MKNMPRANHDSMIRLCILHPGCAWFWLSLGTVLFFFWGGVGVKTWLGVLEETPTRRRTNTLIPQKRSGGRRDSTSAYCAAAHGWTSQTKKHGSLTVTSKVRLGLKKRFGNRTGTNRNHRGCWAFWRVTSTRLQAALEIAGDGASSGDPWLTSQRVSGRNMALELCPTCPVCAFRSWSSSVWRPVRIWTRVWNRCYHWFLGIMCKDLAVSTSTASRKGM